MYYNVNYFVSILFFNELVNIIDENRKETSNWHSILEDFLGILGLLSSEGIISILGFPDC